MQNLRCKNCKTEITQTGCQCGAYEPEFDRRAAHVEQMTGYREEYYESQD